MAETLTLQELFAQLEAASAAVKVAEQTAETVRRTSRAGITAAMAARRRTAEEAAKELAEAQRIHDAPDDILMHGKREQFADPSNQHSFRDRRRIPQDDRFHVLFFQIQNKAVDRARARNAFFQGLLRARPIKHDHFHHARIAHTFDFRHAVARAYDMPNLLRQRGR